MRKRRQAPGYTGTVHPGVLLLLREKYLRICVHERLPPLEISFCILNCQFNHPKRQFKRESV